MHRFFVDKSSIADNQISITGDDFRHIKTVLRLLPGENVILCDSCGTDFLCEIESFEKDFVRTKIIEKTQNISEPNVQITLFQGYPKADKMDFIIQKCVELGITQIVPMLTERSVVRLDKAKATKKLERLQKISEAAAKQSGRGIIPKILPISTFLQALELSTTLDGAIIPYEKEQVTTLKTFASAYNGNSVGIFIGPEGGFSETEISAAKAANVLPVTLGRRILRTETAGLVSTAILLHELD